MYVYKELTTTTKKIPQSTKEIMIQVMGLQEYAFLAITKDKLV